MGKFTNMLGAQITGNVGAVNFRMVDGEMVAAKRSYTNSSKGDGASYAQRLHRVRMPNVAALFHQIMLIERRGWENKKPNQTDFNMFTRANLANSPVFLTKQEAELGAAIIAPYAASRGNLSQIKPYYVGDHVVDMNLSIGSLSVDDWADMTIGEFSQRIIDNNPGWKVNDKLSVCRLVQIERSISGTTVPQVEVTYFEITMNLESTTVFIDIPGFGTLQPDATNPDAQGNRRLNFLDGGDGFFAIHSRESAGYLECSSEDVVMENPFNDIYINHINDEAKQVAMDSYGYKDMVLLDPNSENQQPAVNNLASVSSVAFGQGAGSVPVYNGASITLSDELALNIVGANLADDASGTNSRISLSFKGAYESAWTNVPIDFESTSHAYVLGLGGDDTAYRLLVNGQLYAEFTLNYE